MVKLISTWQQLSEVKSTKGYHLEITPEDGNGWIIKTDSDEWVQYLSTHTFYGSQHESSTEMLQHYGFDVVLENWDA